jgi:hypothetical protein
MSRERQEKIVDTAQLALGGPFYLAVSALVGAVMLVGYALITGVDRALHHS